LAGGINRFGYVGGSPVNYADPYGLYCYGGIGCLFADQGHQEALATGVVSILTGTDAGFVDETDTSGIQSCASPIDAAVGLGFSGYFGRKASTETVQRWMSKSELKATQETGLLRGGRDGTHYVTNSSNSNALRARQRSALPQTPEVKVTLEVQKGLFSQPSRVEPAFNMLGNGMERAATGKIPVTVKRIQ